MKNLYLKKDSIKPLELLSYVELYIQRYELLIEEDNQTLGYNQWVLLPERIIMFIGIQQAVRWILVWFSLSEVKMATKTPAMFYLLAELYLSRHTSSHLTKSAYIFCLPSTAKRKRNADSFYKIYLFLAMALKNSLQNSLDEILQCQRQSPLDTCTSAAILSYKERL